MSKVKYPDDIIRARRQSIEVAENLEVHLDRGGFTLELFRDEHSFHEKLMDALDEAATLILGDGAVDSVEFFQTGGVWCVDMCALRNDLYARRRHG